MSVTKRKRKAVWNCPPFPNNYRYVPMSLSGGTGWSIYDRRENRFPSDREIKRITIWSLENEQLPVH